MKEINTKIKNIFNENKNSQYAGNCFQGITNIPDYTMNDLNISIKMIIFYFKLTLDYQHIAGVLVLHRLLTN